MNDLKIIKNWEIRITRIANLQSVEFFSFIHKSDRLIIKKNSHWKNFYYYLKNINCQTYSDDT